MREFDAQSTAGEVIEGISLFGAGGGFYLEGCHVAGPAEKGSDAGYLSYALGPVQADRLWELSEQLVGQTFH